MIILDNLRFASISFWVYLGYLSIISCRCFTNFCRLPERVSLGGRFEEESLLGALIHSKPSSFAIHFSAVISCGFQLLFQYQKGQKITFYLSSCWLGNFCVYTGIPHHFSWCSCSISARLCLLILQGEVKSKRIKLHKDIQEASQAPP